MRYKNSFWFCVIGVSCLCVSCATVKKESPVADAELKEFHGDHHVFWPYANAGLSAAKAGDLAAAKKYFLRAYRNTGMALAPVADSGAISEIQNYALKFDSLTPLPGTGPVTNEVVNAALNHQRSFAAYEWALAAGHLGDYADAEKALLYSLRLEESQDTHDQQIAARHFELARLYHAWGKTEAYLEHYRLAFASAGKEMPNTDPIGYANVLDEFSTFLAEAGMTDEAAQIRAQSAVLRKNNPNRQAKYTFESYPTLKAP
jgi:Tfp pilus assembly protein PilF